MILMPYSMSAARFIHGKLSTNQTAICQAVSSTRMVMHFLSAFKASYLRQGPGEFCRTGLYST